MPSVTLAPIARKQYTDSSGNPIVGGKLFTYLAGTSTQQETYTDSTGATPNSNPIILDASGRTPYGVWYEAGILYKEVLALSTDTDPPTSPIFTADNLSGVNDTSTPAALASSSQWVASGLTPTYVSGTQFTLASDQTAAFHAGRRLRLTVTAGTVYGEITTSVYGALTTVTVTLDSGSLDAGLSAVDLGIVTIVNSAIPSPTAMGAQPLDAELTTLSAMTAQNASDLVDFAAGTFGGWGFRNYIINGNMLVWQRATTSTSVGYQTADRWYGAHTGAATTLAQSTDVPSGVGSSYSMKVTNVTSTGGPSVIHRIEGVNSRRLVGKKVTISFWAKQTAGTSALYLSLGSADALDDFTPYTYISGTTFALTSSWVKYTYTSGNLTAATANGLMMYFSKAGTDTSTYHLAMVQLEEGESSTPFDIRPVGVETFLCQRYYVKSSTYGMVGKADSAIAITIGGARYPATMRIAPTATLTDNTAFSGAFAVSSLGAWFNAATVTATIQSATTGSWWVTLSGFAGLTIDAVALSSSAVSCIGFDAELA